jgi:hypothetical protein
MSKRLVIPALAIFGLLAACSDMSGSGASGISSRSGIGAANLVTGGGSSSYQNELRAENSN